MERIGHNKSDIKMFYEISKTTEIVVDTAIGNTESIEITEVVKQGLIFAPIMCCATTAKVNDVEERVDYNYGEIEIGTLIYISEQVKAGNIQRTKKYKYLGITINEEGNLKGHIEELKQKRGAISREMEITGSRNQFGKEEIRVQLKLFEARFTPAIIYGIEAQGGIKKGEMKEIDRIQGKTLKKIFKLPLSTTYTGMLMETEIWPAEQRIQYAALMLYHNTKNNDEKRKIKKMIDEQERDNCNNTLYKKYNRQLKKNQHGKKK